MKRLVAVVWFLLACAVAETSQGQETAHYPNGTSGLKAGTTPPPGYYWLIYNRYYEAERMTDASGGIATGPGGEPMGFCINAFANVHRIINMTEYKILGADYGWNVVIPVVDTSLDIGAAGVQDSSFKLADLNAEPFVIEWHRERYDFGFVYGLFAPSASRSAEHPSWPGKAFWTNYAGLAGTYYFDEERTWTLSALSRYEVNSWRSDSDVRPGDNFSFEWGLGKTILPGTDVGVSGYCSWQTTDDKGADAVTPWVRDRAFGVGPELQFFSPEHNFGYHFRYWWEFETRDRPEGQILTLTIVKPF